MIKLESFHFLYAVVAVLIYMYTEQYSQFPLLYWGIFEIHCNNRNSIAILLSWSKRTTRFELYKQSKMLLKRCTISILAQFLLTWKVFPAKFASSSKMFWSSTSLRVCVRFDANTECYKLPVNADKLKRWMSYYIHTKHIVINSNVKIVSYHDSFKVYCTK